MTANSELAMHKVRAIDGSEHIRFTRADQSVYLPLAATTWPISETQAALAKRGMPSSGRRTGEIIEALLLSLEERRSEPLIAEVGWTAPYFALPDGQVIQPAGVDPAQAIFVTDDAARCAGTIESWSREVGGPIREHNIVAFTCLLNFPPSLAGWADIPAGKAVEIIVENDAHSRMLEAVHTSVSGKSAITFATLCGRLADQLLVYRDMPLLITGTSIHMAGESNSKRAQGAKALLRTVEHQKGHGVTLIGAAPMSQLVGDLDDIVALLSREVITVPISASRQYGAFTCKPSSTGTANDAAAALTAAASKTRGVSLPVFIEALAASRAEDEPRLTERIQKKIRKFRQAAEVDFSDPVALSIVDTFAAIYAAGKLAQSFDALPDDWPIRRIVLRCYRLAVANRPQSFDDRLRSLAAMPSTLQVGAPEPTKKAIRDARVMLLRRSKHEELIIRPEAIHEVFPDWSSIRKTPEVLRRLQRGAKDRQQIQRVLLQGGDKEWVFCFRKP